MQLTLLRWLMIGWLLWANNTDAQTAWPDYIASLEPALSESAVTATLPPDVLVTPPDAALSVGKARWSGVWNGWACRALQCDVKVVVERLSETGATVVYAGASAGQGLITERVEAQFINDELQMGLHAGAKLILRMRTGGDVELSLWKPDKQLISAGVLTQKSLDYTRSVERVPTSWIQNGNPQTLEMVIYKPHGTGPFPTLIFNHGSTGKGDRPDWFTFTWTSPEVSRYFVRKGWQVVFPQRRGRGRSDGLYDEGFEKDRSRYSCQPELSLPGLERAMTDLDAVMVQLKTRTDVDAGRLLLGGVSRGGILSVVYAGTRANSFVGVLNFVGGWMGDGCVHADTINTGSFRRGASFSKPMLWLYGDKDPFYSLRHSRKNFEAFEAAGGKGTFLTFDPAPGQNGHQIHATVALWQSAMDSYLQLITPR